jgi:hypothetical protein
MMPQKREIKEEKKRKVISIKEIDVKKATIVGIIAGGIIGFIAGIILALTMVQLPFIGGLGAIVGILLLTAIGALLGGIFGLIATSIINIGLKATDGYDIYYE